MKGFDYYNPAKIIFGSGRLKELDRILDGRRALLLTTRGFARRGLIDRIKALTPNVVQVIDTVEANPDFVNLRMNYQKINHQDFDVIVSLGGGSVIDSAKVLSVYFDSSFLGTSILDSSAPDSTAFDLVEILIRQGKCNQDYRLKPIIAIPTTAGTGSEVTPWATVWDNVEKKKFSLHLPELWPEACICDPELTLSLGRELTVQTALDALSHALEVIWNKNANPVSTQKAIYSAKTIIESLPVLVRNLDDMEYREKMMLAALMAGLAFSNTQTAIAHAMSYYITAHKGIPHGLACSFSLPDIIETIIGTDESIDMAIKEIFGELSSRKLRQLYRDLGISGDYQSYGMTISDMEKMKLSLLNVARAKNSLVDIEKLFARWNIVDQK